MNNSGIYVFDDKTKSLVGFYPFNREGELINKTVLNERPVGDWVVKAQTKHNHFVLFQKKASYSETLHTDWRYLQSGKSGVLSEAPDYIKAYMMVVHP